MNIDTFIEYAKVIRKYRPILEEYNYRIDICDDCLSLSLCDDYSDDIVMVERNKINYTPIEVEEYIKVLIRDKKDELIQKMKELQEEQKKLEILLKTIDNAN